MSMEFAGAGSTNEMEGQADDDPESNSLHRPLLKRNRTLSSTPVAMIGAKVSPIESLDYEYLMGFAYFVGTNFLLTMSASVLCVFFAPTAAGPGIPEIKAYLNGIDTPNMFGATTLIVKIIGSIGAVSAGLDLGKEGPLVHIGTCIASLLGQGGPDDYRINWRWFRYFNNDRDRRDLITCGSSSGVCAAFRSPVGGVLFALEEVATWWRSALLWRTFFSTAVVVVVLRAFIEYCKSGNCGLFGRGGGLIMFDVGGETVRYHAVDIIPITLIGVIGGLLGSLYNHVLHKILRLYNLINEKGKLHKLVLSLSVSLFTSVCLYALPFLGGCKPCDSSTSTAEGTGNLKQFNCPKGYYNDLATLLLTTNDDAVRNIFSVNTPSRFNISSLAIFFMLYCILGLITFGIAVPSGLFLPIILMGSSYGRLLGIAMGKYTHIDRGLYAVLGAASLMAGSMRMTVSLCVIFLELTNNLLLLPITMLVLLIAKSVGDCFNPSIYDIILELKGLPFLDANPEPWMRNITVGELADVKAPVVTLCGIEKVGRIVEVLKNTTYNGFPVVDEERVATELHGVVLRTHLLLVLKKKYFMHERRRTEEWEVREKFSWVDLAERWGKIEDVAVTNDEMEMYVDLHPLTNTTPFTVSESISVAKAMVLFRQVGLRHMLIVPKYQAAGVSPVVGILTRQDLRAHNILAVFPHLAKSKGSNKGH
ncbi:PREDICTED: chloride channel protein CLC-b-like isoform X2 [Ipomoea nil]|uniref:chloride channel protein CLC-b-like isoform X2 n=1 Tax=Ipomoea nil TaxID=35883 RepID=UPI000900857C|nr:PREDICTED: chloride channel protein CLC-b-like isoform X2 [Ipomoea nil]